MNATRSRAARSQTVALVVLALFLTLAATSGIWAQESTEGESPRMRSQRITLNLQNVTLGSVLKVMTQKSGINFLIGSDLVGKEINVYLEDVLVEDALAAIMRANGLWYTRQKGTNIYVIMESPEGPPVATITEVLQTNYSTALELEPTVTAVLTDAGSIVVDERTNSLVVSDIPENMTTLESLVRELDEPTGQVLIEAKIVEFSEEAATDLGVEWNYAAFETGEAGGSGEFSYGSTFNNVHQVVRTESEEGGTAWNVVEDKGNEGLLELTFGKFGDSFIDLQDLGVRLRAMQRDGLAQVLAEPKILTLDNKEASIAITSHIAMAKKVTFREDGTTTIEPIYGDIGVTLKVTPHLNTEEFVTMTLEPVVSSASRSAYFPDEAVDTRQRTAKTTVMVKDAQTIVIGGLLRKDVNETHFKVPLLGDLPLLGNLFRKSVESEVDTEVMVFLTPRILGAESLARLSGRLESEIDAKIGE